MCLSVFSPADVNFDRVLIHPDPLLLSLVMRRNLPDTILG